jgi:AcrR family transcriptional regulator
MSDTRTAILDAAEKSFGARGIQGISLRAILTDSGINPALAHYHFGSKDKLIREILLRRMVPLSEERIRRLDELEARPGDPGYTLREALTAFIEPAIREIERAPHFARFLGQVQSTLDESLRSFFTANLAESLHRFSRAVDRVAPPGLTGAKRLARGFFLLGLIGWTLTDSHLMEALSRGRYPVPRGDALIDELVSFCEAGLTAGLSDA